MILHRFYFSDFGKLEKKYTVNTKIRSRDSPGWALKPTVLKHGIFFQSPHSRLFDRQYHQTMHVIHSGDWLESMYCTGSSAVEAVCNLVSLLAYTWLKMTRILPLSRITVELVPCSCDVTACCSAVHCKPGNQYQSLLSTDMKFTKPTTRLVKQSHYHWTASALSRATRYKTSCIGRTFPTIPTITTTTTTFKLPHTHSISLPRVQSRAMASDSNAKSDQEWRAVLSPEQVST